jgi:hypothetical protein
MRMQGDKEYVNVEGWQYAGGRLGILPIVEELLDLSTEKEILYQCKVKLVSLRHTGADGQPLTVGGAIMVCSNTEKGKQYFQRFAIASMAQTRAIGKAYRNAIAWLMRAAGFAPTPLEEMQYENAQAAPPPHTPIKSATYNQVPGDHNPSGSNTPAEQPRPATTRQKAEILLLLNTDVITREEKEKMTMGINKLDTDRAAEAIKKLHKTIADRRNGSVA